MRFCCKTEKFTKSAQFWSQDVPTVLTKKTSTHTLFNGVIGVQSYQTMPHFHHSCITSPFINKPYVHRRGQADKRLCVFNREVENQARV